MKKKQKQIKHLQEEKQLLCRKLIAALHRYDKVSRDYCSLLQEYTTLKDTYEKTLSVYIEQLQTARRQRNYYNRMLKEIRRKEQEKNFDCFCW